jgi:hypothetical protein
MNGTAANSSCGCGGRRNRATRVVNGTLEYTHDDSHI